MGFEELSGELERSADSECRKILHAAEKNAEKIVEAAKADAEEAVKAAKKEATEFARQEAAERITSAKLSAKKIVDEARDEAVERSLALAWQEYRREALKKPSYSQLMARIIEEGKRELGASSPVLYVRDEDKPLVPGFSTKPLPRQYSGGAILESPNGKVSVNKTLEEIFSQKRLSLRKGIYDRMF
jgi:vacuolar-type H+-ATPase subunit E/Vma4